MNQPSEDLFLPRWGSVARGSSRPPRTHSRTSSASGRTSSVSCLLHKDCSAVRLMEHLVNRSVRLLDQFPAGPIAALLSELHCNFFPMKKQFYSHRSKSFFYCLAWACRGQVQLQLCMQEAPRNRDIIGIFSGERERSAAAAVYDKKKVDLRPSVRLLLFLHSLPRRQWQ